MFMIDVNKFLSFVMKQMCYIIHVFAQQLLSTEKCRKGSRDPAQNKKNVR